MSSDLVWAIVRNNNSFLVKRAGAQFSTEPNNLVNRNTYKYSGLANAKTVGIAAAPRGIEVTTTKAKVASPSKRVSKSTISKGRRHTAKSVANLVAHYRPDLRAAALARASAVLSSQQPAKEQTKRNKGVRAAKRA
ncbi:hypothetical protein K450DRAFT_242884 [Umbelopsis ramanniana AG]|uniref:Ribosomal eL28/Mak16 domain-containing protein n=1 Tax=Umbelopsis ramanniana AG TaxID=1314678 RepID=A0AAD5HCR4_UMBRA|nr:uncharacterized protein K450DRAFT_242884 [Umbelopsis ramanniana AG]KAI8579362.1 hypothetical protein K450DRAFT_242884 [Umbelopsis ramanniana AG]KAI9279046.1 ribosomal protein L28e [Umbelopsis sp. AD052]